MMSSINNPIELKLIVSCNSNDILQIGGNPDTNLLAINNLKFTCLESHDKKYKFEYDDTNSKIHNKSKYLGKGGNTIVMSIKQTRGSNEFNNTYFVIRITDIHNHFNLNKYLDDVSVCGRYIPRVYYYGTLYCADNVQLKFAIVQKCNVFSTNVIENMSDTEKQLFLADLLNCLILIQKNNYVLWDLKIDNVGYVDNYKCVLVDYADDTILDSSLFGTTNTYYPTYMYLNYFSFGNAYDSTKLRSGIYFEKIPVAGLADIILNLFFKIMRNNVQSHSSLFDLHIGGSFSSISGSLLQIDTYNKNNWWVESFANLVNGQKINDYLLLLHENNTKDEFREKLLYVLFDYKSFSGLLSPEYSKIPSFEEIRNKLFESVINEVLNNDEIVNNLVGGNINAEYKIKYQKYLTHNKNIKKILENYDS